MYILFNNQLSAVGLLQSSASLYRKIWIHNVRNEKFSRIVPKLSSRCSHTSLQSLSSLSAQCREPIFCDIINLGIGFFEPPNDHCLLGNVDIKCLAPFIVFDLFTIFISQLSLNEKGIVADFTYVD